MKNIKFLLYLLLSVFIFTACSDGGDGDIDDNGSQKNVNKNVVTNDIAVSRLEFPRLKSGNNKVLVYRTADSRTYDKDRVNFCVEWDCDKKSQRWSCYQLHTGFGGNYSRVATYSNDPSLSRNDYWEQDYYYGSGFDHGHICPNADRTFSHDANAQTFYLTNMQPQYRRFNGYSNSGSDRGEGLWVRLENRIRNWSPGLKSDTLYVCKGGTIDRESDIIMRINGKLIVPRYFFMACLLKSKLGYKGYKAIGFYMEQKNEWATNDDLKQYAVTIDRLEELTGIDLFCNLPDDIEDNVESKVALSDWGLR